MSQGLTAKYNVPGPRYTSYPTVPFWDNATFNEKTWKDHVKKTFLKSNKKEGISIYIHLPFCEQMCTFCGCHKRITKRHEVEKPYIETLLKEWELYCQLFEDKPYIKDIHLGGGTPTFFDSSHLKILIERLLETSQRYLDTQFSFEAHPNTTTKEHLQTLYNLGFRRVSFGIQDYDTKVQKAINRIQTFETASKITHLARDVGYTSVCHDLIFGLPFQQQESVVDTMEKTKALSPDRIAFYSYAHVPWIKGVGQRGFDEKDIPVGAKKLALYETGKTMLTELGYVEIGMDHFSLPTDALYKAKEDNQLHRNFMGYTEQKTSLLIGLGVSSIGDSWTGFAQNYKDLKTYTKTVNEGVLPVFRGHLLTREDLIIRQHILNLMCQFKTSWEDNNLQFPELEPCLSLLKDMQQDRLIDISETGMKVTPKGLPFIRNICMAFDLRLQRNLPKERVFSMTV